VNFLIAVVIQVGDSRGYPFSYADDFHENVRGYDVASVIFLEDTSGEVLRAQSSFSIN